MSFRHDLSRRQALGALGAAALVGAAPSLLAGGASAKAPMLGPAQSMFYRFKLGAFEVTIIRDGATYLSGPYPAFGADQFEEDVAELLAQNHLPPKRWELPYAPVLVNTGSELILFDAGNDLGRTPTSGHLLAGLYSAGYTPGQVDVVALTHLHPDHIGGLMEAGKEAFPNARYVCGEVEYNFWSNMDRLSGDAGTVRRAQSVHENVIPLAPMISFVKNEGEVAPGIHAIDAPGHTPGHMAFHVESEGQRLLIWGDAIVHYVLSFQRPDWPLQADMDTPVAVETRTKLLGMAATDKLLVSGYHLPFPALGYVESAEEAFRYAPVGYQLNL